MLYRHEAWIGRGAIVSLGTLGKVFTLSMVLTLTLRQVDNSVSFQLMRIVELVKRLFSYKAGA